MACWVLGRSGSCLALFRSLLYCKFPFLLGYGVDADVVDGVPQGGILVGHVSVQGYLQYKCVLNLGG